MVEYGVMGVGVVPLTLETRDIREATGCEPGVQGGLGAVHTDLGSRV